MPKLNYIAALLLVAPAGMWLSTAADKDAPRVPVLLELFTSEGCSSCPPADRLLEVLDQKQPVAGADLIVLSEHVDYWDRLGWKDPYSSSQYTARQQEYAGRFSRDGAYTPQLVVDGQFGFVGSDRREAVAAIQKTILERKLPLAISNVLRDGRQIRARIELASADDGGRSGQAILYVAVADNRKESQVSRGENAGQTLAHVGVTRLLKQVGTIDLGGAAAKDVTLTLNSDEIGGSRLVAFLQDPRSGHVLGVAAHKL